MYQIVKRGDKYYIRKAPDTIINPTRNQIIMRILFGEMSSLLKELFGNLHPAERAELLGLILKGIGVGRKEKKPKWVLELEKELGREVSKEEIEEIKKRIVLGI